ncbi:hypothetical protein ACMGDH_01585 [Sphingomonas sp. DT-207]|uniref:hypothetical protein n=1 Tax=Sphingomonas sp. DT-207 TaxID=3396167 RepID=UPI003F19836B
MNRRDSLVATLLAALPLAGDTPRIPFRSLVFVTTLAAARKQSFDPSVALVVLAGYERPGDSGAGQVMVRDLSVDRMRAARDPYGAFVDQSGSGFSRAPESAAGVLREGPLLDWLLARLNHLGLSPLFDLTPGDRMATQALQTAFDATARQEGSSSATTHLPRGHWPVQAELVLDSRDASLVGQGISVSYLHTTVGRGQTGITLRNFGGNTSDFCLDSGPPDTTPEVARQTQRNGILFDWSGGHGTIRSIEARWFNGFGMRFVTVWDSIIENVIAVGCGNDSVHAIEFSSESDTTNHTNINRLQAENSHGRAILFDASCMNMCVDNIHCEGTIGRRGQHAISLLGTAMSYRNARIANNGGNVEVLLGGGGNVYDRFSIETGVIVDYSTGALGRSERSFITHCTIDQFRVLASNRGKLVVSDCTIDSIDIADQMRSVSFVRCIIGSVSIRGNQSDVTFEDCDITGKWTSEGNPVVRVRNSRLATGPAGANVYLSNCTIYGDYTTAFNQQIHSHDCNFDGDLILNDDGARFWLSGGFRVLGNLRHAKGEAFGACSVEGTVAGSVDPHWYGTSGSWPPGTLRARPDAGPRDSLFTRFDGQNWSAFPR